MIRILHHAGGTERTAGMRSRQMPPEALRTCLCSLEIDNNHCLECSRWLATRNFAPWMPAMADNLTCQASIARVRRVTEHRGITGGGEARRRPARADGGAATRRQVRQESVGKEHPTSRFICVVPVESVFLFGNESALSVIILASSRSVRMNLAESGEMCDKGSTEI